MYTLIIKSRYATNLYHVSSLQDVITANQYSDCGATRIVNVYECDYITNINDAKYHTAILTGTPKKVNGKYRYTWSSPLNILTRAYFSNATQSKLESAYFVDPSKIQSYALEHGYDYIYDANGHSEQWFDGFRWNDYRNKQIPLDKMMACD